MEKIEEMAQEHYRIEVGHGICRVDLDLDRYALTALDVEHYTDRGFSAEEIAEIEKLVRHLLIAGAPERKGSEVGAA